MELARHNSHISPGQKIVTSFWLRWKSTEPKGKFSQLEADLRNFTELTWAMLRNPDLDIAQRLQIFIN